MFLPPPQPPSLPPPAWSSSVRRPLRDRIIEVLHYFSDEIDGRRAGSLGEAQAAGYVAGRLRRAEYAAAVQSFRTGPGEHWQLALVLLICAALGLAAVTQPPTLWLGLLLVGVLGGLLLLLLTTGVFNVAPDLLRLVLPGKTSQSVIAGRAARGKKTRWRVLVVAPLDGPPQPPIGREALLLAVGLVTLLALAIAALAVAPTTWLRAVGAGLALSLLVLGGAVAVRKLLPAPLPAIHGAGELTALLMVAEELEPLQTVEVWIVALGGSSISQANVRALSERYPFSPGDTCVINLHDIAAGQPVFVTREGWLRERRVDRLLLAAATAADAADMSIDAEPRRLRVQSMAQPLQQRGFRSITISSDSANARFTSPEVATVERCVRLVIGIIRELDS